MLHYALNHLQTLCIQIQIHPQQQIPCFSSWFVIKLHRNHNLEQKNNNMKVAT
jgi:hypothetical protein